MKPYPIRIEGDPILRAKCTEVTQSYPDLAEVVERMHCTLDLTGYGAGLAAPQIGRQYRIFILGGPSGKIPHMTFINPEIVETKGAKRSRIEGCLSVPLVYAKVNRWQKIRLKWFDLDFVEHTEMFRNFEALVIQHEMDHLDGVQFYDRSKKFIDKHSQIAFNRIKKGDIPKVKYEIHKPITEQELINDLQKMNEDDQV